MSIERHKELRRRRHRQMKIKKLRTRLTKTTDVRQRAALIRKIQTVSPNAPVPEK